MVESNQTLNGKFLVVVRHGERLDMLSPDLSEAKETLIRNEHDTPLSKHGFMQALQTGKYISSALLSKLKTPTLHLLSSPFS